MHPALAALFLRGLTEEVCDHISHISFDMLKAILHKIVAQPRVYEAVQKFFGVDECLICTGTPK